MTWLGRYGWAVLAGLGVSIAGPSWANNLPQTDGFTGTNVMPELATNSSASVVPGPEALPFESMSPAEQAEHQKSQLELARHYRHMRLPREAEPILIELLSGTSSEAIKQQALLELAMVAKDGGELSRAQQIYAQYLSRWPNDLLIPEILLHQGQLFREMGLNSLALAKFYGVMT